MVWDKDSIERLRIFKLDLLGVRGFDVISPAALERRFDFHDREVWENIRKGKTIGCFQLESPLARENLQKILPENLGDLAISVAIIRPGPARSGMKQAYIERREPLHPVLKQIFPHTRGAGIFFSRAERTAGRRRILKKYGKLPPIFLSMLSTRPTASLTDFRLIFRPGSGPGTRSPFSAGSSIREAVIIPCFFISRRPKKTVSVFYPRM